jgi:4-hydroxy-tetrahydrodipicolinate reductase
MVDKRIIVVGAGGRMGRMLIETLHVAPSANLVGAVEREGSPLVGQDSGMLSGIGINSVVISDDPLPLFATADAVIDFTTPSSTTHYAALAAQARIVHVVGTTGMGSEDLAKLEAAARHAVIIRSGNMSLGVNLLAALVKRVAKTLGEDFDIEILEMHHRMKVDAPSGTALLLGEAVASGRDILLDEAHSVRVRDGHTGIRTPGTIGFAALRGGTVVGDHSVIFAGPSERITLSHAAEDRAIFARGAVRAALWGCGKKPGLYSMMDVLNLGDI